MEFFGDSILHFIITDFIYQKFSGLNQGELTQLRIKLECNATLSRFAMRMGLARFIKYYGNTNLNSSNSKVLADVFEAIVSAIYLDGGIGAAKEFVLRFIHEELNHCSDEQLIDTKFGA